MSLIPNNFLFHTYHHHKIIKKHSVPFSPSVVSDSLWPHGLQHTRLPCLSPIPRPCSKHVHRVSDAIQPSHPLSFPSSPAINLSQHQGLLQWVSSLVQFSSVAPSCLTLCDPMDCSTLGLPVHHQFPESPKPMSIESMMPSNHLILCCPLLLLPSIFPSIRVFSNESALRIRWLKYWSFSFNISPSNEHPGLISFRMDWFYLLAVQGTLKSLLQHHISKASVLQCSAFFTVQISHPYMTTGKTIALTRWTYVSK